MQTLTSIFTSAPATTPDTTGAAPLTISGRGGEGITLHTFDADGAVRMGTYRSAADAWRAVDELDLAAA